MGNACTINCPRVISSQASSLFPSISFPVNIEFSEDNGSQYSSMAIQARIPDSVANLGTISINKCFKRRIYSLNNRNLQKIIERQQQMDISLSVSDDNDDSNNAVMSLPSVGKDEEYDSSTQQKSWLANREEQNKDIMRRFNLFEGNSKEQEKLHKRDITVPNKFIREEKTTMPSLFKCSAIENKEELTAQEERERRIAAGLSKIFGDTSCGIGKIRSTSLNKESSVPEENHNRLFNKREPINRDGICLSERFQLEDNSSSDMVKTEGDEGRYIGLKKHGVKKSVVESILARGNLSAKKSDENNIHNKSKSLITYCGEEMLEKTIIAELYEGVSMPQTSTAVQAEKKEEPMKKEMPALLSERKCDYNTNGTNKNYNSIERKYGSNQGWSSARKGTENSLCLEGSPTSEFLLFNRELRWDKQLRNESIAERLMESMLEERVEEKEPFNLVLASGEKCPLPIARRNLFDSDKKSYRNILDSYKKESQAKGHESIGSVAKDDNNKVTRQKETEQRVLFETPKKNEKPVATCNTIQACSPIVPIAGSGEKRFVSVTELLDVEEATTTKEEPQIENNQKEEPVGEQIVIEKAEEMIKAEQKTIFQEVENLQKEVLERISHVTSSLKSKTLDSEKLHELKEIQDKLQRLTRLGSLMPTSDLPNIQPPENTHNTPINITNNNNNHNTPINQLRVEIIEDEVKNIQQLGVADMATVSNNICSPIPTDPSFTMKPYDIKPEPTPKIFDVDLSAIVKKKKRGYEKSREADSSILKPSLMPVESRTTLEFLEVEMDQQQRETWMRQMDPKSYKTLSELDQSGISHTTMRSTKERRPTMNKGHSAESRKSGTNQLYKQVMETTPDNFQLFRKLSNPKNLSTYNEPQLSHRESASTSRPSVNNYAPGKNAKGSVTERSQSPMEARPKLKQEQLLRRQSATTTTTTKKPLVERRSSQNALTSRKTSTEKVRPTAVDIKPAISSSKARDTSRERQVQGRMSVGSTDISRSGLRDTPNKGSANKRMRMEKSLGSEKKRKVSQTTVQYRRESTEPCPEGDLFDLNYDTNKAGLLREEISQLNQRLALTKSSARTMTEPAEDDIYAQRIRMHKVGIDRGYKEGAYSARARKRMEYSNPETARGAQLGLSSERRYTGTNVDYQPELHGMYLGTEPSYTETTRRDYNQSLKMRTKMVEEIAKRQSLMEDSEWVLSMKIPTIPALKNLGRGGIGMKNIM